MDWYEKQQRFFQEYEKLRRLARIHYIEEEIHYIEEMIKRYGIGLNVYDVLYILFFLSPIIVIIIFTKLNGF